MKFVHFKRERKMITSAKFSYIVAINNSMRAQILLLQIIHLN